MIKCNLGEEFLDISRALLKNSSIFYNFWNISSVFWDDSEPTLYVGLDVNNEIYLGINKVFWDSISFNSKLFCISHECLHLIYEHLHRMNSGDRYIYNISSDLVVNHTLIDEFGFNREEIDIEFKGKVFKDKAGELCWVDKVFSDGTKSGLNTEEYYRKLSSLKSKNGLGVNLVDAHKGLCKSDNISEKSNKEVIRKIFSDVPDEEMDSFVNSIRKMAGNCSGAMTLGIKRVEVKKKKKWETVIKDWVRKKVVEKHKIDEQWARKNRRFALIDKEMLIPTEMETEETEDEKHKIKVWFFLDTSGSCAGYASRFWRAVESLPGDRFDVELFCFDTSVYKVNLDERRLYGFGGTSFGIIEKYIIDNCKGIYPDAVWILTDGYGDSVFPKIPGRWYWFLTSHYKGYIPKKSNIYMLKDYE